MCSSVSSQTDLQGDLLKTQFTATIDLDLSLMHRVDWGNWTFFKSQGGEYFHKRTSASAKSTCLMLVRHSIVLRWFLISFFLFICVPSRAQTSISLFFTGARSSELEPCGCTALQQGGLPHEAALYAKNAAPTDLRLDAGGWVGDEPFRKDFAAMKTRFLLRGLARLGLDAVNFGAGEATLSRFYYDQLKKEHPEALAPLISANVCLTSAPQILAFPDSRLLTRSVRGRTVRIAVTGVAVAPLAGSAPTDPEVASTGSGLVRSASFSSYILPRPSGQHTTHQIKTGVYSTG